MSRINTNPMDDEQTRRNWQELGRFVHDETLLGTIDGVNLIFTLANRPLADTLVVYVDGVRIQPTVAYTVTGDAVTFAPTITFTVAPTIGQWLSASYRY